MLESSLKTVGSAWVVVEIESFTEVIDRMSPAEFSERYRYLPESVTSIPGPMSWDVNPFMREIVECFDVDSPVREVSLMKGAQITYTTLLESGILYLMAHVSTVPCMYMTADKGLANARIENNFLPMIEQSGFSHIIRSADVNNKRKTGKTANWIQWEGGGYLVPFGAKNADKMRQFSILALLKDEIDAWPILKDDGDPDKLSDARCDGYTLRRKIFRGSTPLIKGVSRIEKAYKQGDQRKYLVLCRSCGFAQELRWSAKVGGFKWDFTEKGILIPESVRYDCQNCGNSHFEHDKEVLFSEKHGAHWKPTATAVSPGIRSYHLPGLYSPIGMRPWSKSVGDYLEAYDPVVKEVKDIQKFQVFYNNVLGVPFEVMGSKVTFVAVSAHRRASYRTGEIPNDHAEKFAGGPVLFLTCQVDVHKNNLAVAVMGWTTGFRCYLVEYLRIRDDSENGCEDGNSPAWQALREIIEEKVYKSATGVEYRIEITLIDAGYANAVTTAFCEEYQNGVYPILGRTRTAWHSQIKEFAEFKTQAGTIGYKILVDHYKDRLAPVLRRDWIPEAGEQREYHFNAPIDVSDKQLKELTREVKREKKDDRGRVSHEWYRPGNAPNELWDLLVYGHAAVEILAWAICVREYELEKVDWDQFWQFWGPLGGS